MTEPRPEAVTAGTRPVLRRIAERQRFVLVWRDERGGEICRSTPLVPGAERIAIPLDAQHCDLLTGEDGEPEACIWYRDAGGFRVAAEPGEPEVSP